MVAILQAKRPPVQPFDSDGAGCRNRTRDIQFTKLALYQLS
jgi:hypothetical protein